MKKQTSIFKFNHINVDKELEKTLKKYYAHYHKKYYTYKLAYKRANRLNLLTTIGSTTLLAVGTVAGTATLNIIVLGTLNGLGLVLKVYSETKKL